MVRDQNLLFPESPVGHREKCTRTVCFFDSVMLAQGHRDDTAVSFHYPGPEPGIGHFPALGLEV